MTIQLSWEYPISEYGKITNSQYVKWFKRLGFDVSYTEGDLLVLMGGADIGTNLERDSHELKLIDNYLNKGKPIFGICRGMQLLGLRYGCTFIQDIPSIKNTLKHTSSAAGWRGDSSFHKIFDSNKSYVVNSRHHQGFFKSNNLNLFCEEFLWSEDGIIEGIRGTDGLTNFSGVQFHPEREEVWDTDSETIAIIELYRLIKQYSHEIRKH